MAEYDFHHHVASDVGTDQVYLPPSNYPLQSKIDEISSWTRSNLMKINESKCYYMIFSRSETQFSTRLNINGSKMEQTSVANILGVWISEDLSWSRHCKQVCISAYSRLSMLKQAQICTY